MLLKTKKNLKPTEKIEVYMDKLEDTHTKFRNNENALRRLKELYHDKYVIKAQEVPDSYFKLQEKIALDRGYGHITYTENQKQQEIQTIITEQQKSLDIWLDYFISEDADVYPMWAKYWAFQGMLSLGVFDKEQQRFNKRAKGLILPKTIEGSLYLDSLTNAKGLVFPEKIGGSLYLKALTNIEGLVLPKKVGSMSISRQVINQLDESMPEEFDSIGIFDNDDDTKNSASAIIVPKELYEEGQKTIVPGFDRYKGMSVILYEKGKKLSECEIISTHIEQSKEENNKTF